LRSRAPSFTGERIHVDDGDFRLDATQHLAAYEASLSLVAGKVVLDAGCGDARATSRLLSSARAVVGLDRDREVVRTAFRSGAPGVLLACGDLLRLGFRDASFDVVCCFQVLEHLPDPAGFLRGVVRVLRPDGLLVLTTPNRLRSFSENPYHLKEYSPGELRALVEPWFSSVELLGVFGNDRVRALQGSRERTVRAILRLDPFGCRRLIPAALRKRAFAILARWVRGRVRAAHPESYERVSESDYLVAGDHVEESLDLLAVCRR
jgi:SAM-dependent methyltransferase